MFKSHNSQDNDLSTKVNKDWSVDSFVIQGDAIYDYERIPPAWTGVDEQPIVYTYGDSDSQQHKRSEAVLLSLCTVILVHYLVDLT